MTKNQLSFGKGNAKLGKDTATFSLPAGHTCSGALECLSRANRVTGKLTDGPKNRFRCYAASAENIFPNVRKSRWHNLETLKGKDCAEMAKTIQNSLPRKAAKIRIHVSGDYINQTYFDAWLAVAASNPTKVFYSYTKCLPFWIARKNVIPKNFKLVASRGGKWDALIEPNGLRNVLVVGSEAQAAALGLPIDHDDSHAHSYSGNFALLIHNTQPAGTQANRDVVALRKAGKGGYKAEYFAHYAKAA